MYCSAIAAVPIRSWMNTNALGELLVAVDDRLLRDAPGRVLADALDDQRHREPARPLHLAADRKHREGRHWNAMIVHQRLRQVLAARQHQAARVAAGVGHAHQF